MNIHRGEVIRVNLNPISGREQAGNARPCLVISHTEYNQARNGMVVIMPITSTIRPEIKLMVPIPEGFAVSGSVIVEQIRTLDLSGCWWKSTNTVLPTAFVDQIVNMFSVIIKTS